MHRLAQKGPVMMMIALKPCELFIVLELLFLFQGDVLVGLWISDCWHGQQNNTCGQ